MRDPHVWWMGYFLIGAVTFGYAAGRLGDSKAKKMTGGLFVVSVFWPLAWAAVFGGWICSLLGQEGKEAGDDDDAA